MDQDKTLQEFDRDGIRFVYPEGWDIEVEDEEDEMGWTVSVASSDTAFLILTYQVGEDPTRLVETTLESIQEDFEDVGAQPVQETLNSQPAFGYDVEFFNLDLTNIAWLRGVEGPEGGILVMAQVTDQDRPIYEEVLKGIMQSLNWEED